MDKEEFKEMLKEVLEEVLRENLEIFMCGSLNMRQKIAVKYDGSAIYVEE